MASMGGGASWMGLVGNIVKAVGNRYDAYEQQKELKYLATLRERAAEDALAMGQIKARFVRREGRRFEGQARADYAASGVLVDSGSTAEVEAEIMRGTERDALLTIYQSEVDAAALRAEAKQLRRNATNVQVKATFENIATVLGS